MRLQELSLLCLTAISFAASVPEDRSTAGDAAPDASSDHLVKRASKGRNSLVWPLLNVRMISH